MLNNYNYDIIWLQILYEGCEAMEKKLGAIFVAISATGFGFLPIFAGLAYRNGANTVTLLAARFTAAALILWAIVLIKKIEYNLGRQKIIYLILLGSIGYNSATAAYFSALNYISTPLVALVFYTNPIIVSLLSFFIIKEEISKNKAAALGISTLGLIMIVGFSLGNINIKGIFLAMLAAFSYSIYIIAGDRAVKGLDPIIVTTYVTTGCSITVNLMGLFTGSLIKMTFHSWFFSFMTAVFSTVIAILLFYEGMKRIGPSKVAIISTIEPVVTTIMAAIIFHDILSLPQIIGGLLVIAGIIILQRPEKKSNDIISDEVLEQHE